VNPSFWKVHRYEDVVGAINEGLILTDTAGRITFMNVRARELIGLTLETDLANVRDFVNLVTLTAADLEPAAHHRLP